MGKNWLIGEMQCCWLLPFLQGWGEMICCGTLLPGRGCTTDMAPCSQHGGIQDPQAEVRKRQERVQQKLSAKGTKRGEEARRCRRG